MDVFYCVQKLLTNTQNYECVNHFIIGYIVNFSTMNEPLLHPGMRNVCQQATIHGRATGLGDMDK